MLDGVGNPHNLGAIARTAAFFGVPRIVLSDHRAQAKPSDASYRVAEGGQHRITAPRLRNRDQCCVRLGDCAFHLRRRKTSVEREGAPTVAELRIQKRGAFGAAHGADDARKTIAALVEIVAGRIAEPEADQRCNWL